MSASHTISRRLQRANSSPQLLSTMRPAAMDKIIHSKTPPPPSPALMTKVKQNDSDDLIKSLVKEVSEVAIIKNSLAKDKNNSVTIAVEHFLRDAAHVLTQFTPEGSKEDKPSILHYKNHLSLSILYAAKEAKTLGYIPDSVLHTQATKVRKGNFKRFSEEYEEELIIAKKMRADLEKSSKNQESPRSRNSSSSDEDIGDDLKEDCSSKKDHKHKKGFKDLKPKSVFIPICYGYAEALSGATLQRVIKGFIHQGINDISLFFSNHSQSLEDNKKLDQWKKEHSDILGVGIKQDDETCVHIKQLTHQELEKTDSYKKAAKGIYSLLSKKEFREVVIMDSVLYLHRKLVKQAVVEDEKQQMSSTGYMSTQLEKSEKNRKEEVDKLATKVVTKEVLEEVKKSTNPDEIQKLAMFMRFYSSHTPKAVVASTGKEQQKRVKV